MLKMLSIAALALGVTSAGAMAADLLTTPAPEAAAPASAAHWDGIYAGVQAGVASVKFNDDEYDGYYGGDATGYLLGGQVGVNYHLTDTLVGGVEADAIWNQTIVNPDNWTADLKLEWNASLRARLGLDLGDWLPYVTAGVAFAHAQTDDGTYYKHNPTGWTAGIGVEYALADAISTRVEYRYTDFGTDDYGYDLRPVEQSLRLGVNFHF